MPRKKKQETEGMSLTEGALASSLKEKLISKWGDMAQVARKSSQRRFIGLKSPSLLFEYLIANSVFPLGKVVQLYGEPKVGKSGVSFAFGDLFLRQGGYVIILDTENKLNEDWLSSIVDEQYLDRVIITPCQTVDEWQTKVTDSIKLVRREFKSLATKHGGSGMLFPVLIVVDSISGVAFGKSAETILKRGFADREFPAEALSISRYLKVISPEIARLPVTLLLVNHWKPGKDDKGKLIDHRPGGKAPDFHTSFSFLVQALKKYRSGATHYNMLKMTCTHNSFGEDKRSVAVRLEWKFDDEGQQRTRLNFGRALIEFLLGLEGSVGTRVKKLLGLGEVRTGVSFATELGIGRKDAVSHGDLAQVIESNGEVLEELRKILSIRKGIEYKAGDDYEQLLVG